MKKKFLLISILISLFFFSCDVVSPVGDSYYYISDTIENNTDTTETVEKKVLIIDFTAIRCPNCPGSHEAIEEIQSIYPNKVIAIAIHGTLLANPNASYPYDLRTAEGTEIISTFGISGIPTGMVDYFDKTQLSAYSTWNDKVQTELSTEPIVKLDLTNVYNDSENSVNINIKIKALQNFENSLKVAVYLTEDSIITKQATEVAPGYIENYVQMNVFRDAVSNVWGDEIYVGGVAADSEEQKTYSLNLNSGWVAKNCKIVVFVFNQDNLILNVTEQKIK